MAHINLSEEDLFLYLKVNNIQIDDELLQKAKTGDGDVLYSIGELYNNKQDYEKAMAWFLLSANKYNSNAQYAIADMYQNGRGVTKSFEQAMEFHLLAYTNGNDKSANSIGTLYKMGHGVTRDYQQAMEWYMKSARQGNNQAMFNIGTLYKEGEGVKKNKQQALEWFQMSYDHGNTNAKEKVDKLKRQGFLVDLNSIVRPRKEQKTNTTQSKAINLNTEPLFSEKKITELENRLKILEQANQITKNENNQLSSRIYYMDQGIQSLYNQNNEISNRISLMDQNWRSSQTELINLVKTLANENQKMKEKMKLLEQQAKRMDELCIKLQSVEKIALRASIDGSENDICYDG